jgi:aspartyl-tRNA(Asn)/glutamyl-tRNA(Gln) amidotransferase subunit C
MALTREQVQHIATLCRIGLTEEELERYSQQLSHILEQFRVLQELDTSGVEPTGHAVALQNVMREDEVRPSLPRHLVLMNGPRVEEECFRVPMVLEES